MEQTGSLPGELPSFSQPCPPSYRHTLALPPRTSSLMATIGYPNLDSYTQNTLALEFPDSAAVSGAVQQHEKNCRWTRLKRVVGRSLSARSTSSVNSLKPLPPISDTDSADYSIRALYTYSAAENAQTTWRDSEYDKQLNGAVASLKNDVLYGAREMADSALSKLSSLIVAAATTAQNRNELWEMTIFVAKELSKARPSMAAAITSCLLRALDEVSKLWEALDEKRNKAPDDLAAMARRQIVRILEKRKEAGMRLSDNFAERLRAYCRQRLDNTHTLTILTLSNSNTIRASILTTLSTLIFLNLNLLILESRPRFEGATMASQLVSSTSADARSRLRIRILPDCAVATAAKDAQLVLLGAKRISASGDVSSKIGSLAAAVCIKTLNPKAQIVAISDVDKIVAKGVEEVEKETHPASEMLECWRDETRRELASRIVDGSVEVFDEWFEWVPAEYVDGYVTENGILDTEGVEKVAEETGELREKIFG
ncbi:translation initiation factor eif-2b subunit family protein [Paraphaeosphaeria minitans]|uniref:Translation initiation factor eif-2b subunit family protein n=1 Tax=Paraphaeosphaeria minitans TaxID=565426 RepID=A0A9P6GSK9_9PLEO|nr:translation initiation factor eif-2b subunit family protein [Paraphaeosphaeria minitans]